MTTLLETLGIDPTKTAVMFINAPDGVLATLGALKPRPSFATSLLTAEPSAAMVWWANEGDLTLAVLSRWKWMLTAASGYGWLVVDEEESTTERPVEVATAALRAAGFAIAAYYQLPGEAAIAVVPE